MKRKPDKYKKVTKGTSSAVVLSILIHAGLFLLAGLLVVFTVVNRSEPEFEAPQAVERPKMKLRKPRVRPSKSSKPKTPDRITATKGPAVLPEVKLPSMGGIGGDAGYDFAMDIDFDFEPTLLGTPQSIGSDLEGTYYDTKFTRSGTYAPVSNTEWRQAGYNFFRDGWDPRHFKDFYRSPKKLYTTYLLLPPAISAYAPVAFGMPDDMASGGNWYVHYKGELIHKDGITFRFWAGADDSIAIRVDGENVLMASLTYGRAAAMYGDLWDPTAGDHMRYRYGHGPAGVGDWITLEPGVPKDIEVLAADNNAANASFVVMVQEKGVRYPKKWDNQGPELPLFRLDELTHDQLDLIYANFRDGEVNCTNGPIFRAY